MNINYLYIKCNKSILHKLETNEVKMITTWYDQTYFKDKLIQLMQIFTVPYKGQNSSYGQHQGYKSMK
jgi:hypothetical protein